MNQSMNKLDTIQKSSKFYKTFMMERLLNKNLHTLETPQNQTNKLQKQKQN